MDPFANHAAPMAVGDSDVAARAVGDVAKDNFLRDRTPMDTDKRPAIVLAIWCYLSSSQPHWFRTKETVRCGIGLTVVQWFIVGKKDTSKQRVALLRDDTRRLCFSLSPSARIRRLCPPANLSRAFLKFPASVIL